MNDEQLPYGAFTHTELEKQDCDGRVACANPSFLWRKVTGGGSLSFLSQSNAL